MVAKAEKIRNFLSGNPFTDAYRKVATWLEGSTCLKAELDADLGEHDQAILARHHNQRINTLKPFAELDDYDSARSDFEQDVEAALVPIFAHLKSLDEDKRQGTPEQRFFSLFWTRDVLIKLHNAQVEFMDKTEAKDKLATCRAINNLTGALSDIIAQLLSLKKTATDELKETIAETHTMVRKLRSTITFGINKVSRDAREVKKRHQTSPANKQTRRRYSFIEYYQPQRRASMPAVSETIPMQPANTDEQHSSVISSRSFP